MEGNEESSWDFFTSSRQAWEGSFVKEKEGKKGIQKLSSCVPEAPEVGKEARSGLSEHEERGRASGKEHLTTQICL